MKFSKTSGLVSLLFAGSAAAAPHHAAGSGFGNHEASNLPSVADTVNRLIDAEHHAPQRRDDFGFEAVVPLSVKDTVDQVTGAEHHAVQRRCDDRKVEEKASDQIDSDKHGAGTRQVWDHTVEFGCNGGDWKKVSPNWLWAQVQNKIDYLTHPDMEEPPTAEDFPNGNAGLDWFGWQDNQDRPNKNEVQTGENSDWVKMTIAWEHYGIDSSTMPNELLKAIVRTGLKRCSEKKDEGVRTRGFTARYNNQWAVVLRVAQKNDGEAKKEAGSRKHLFWQTPRQIDDKSWSDFVRKNKKTHPVTTLGYLGDLESDAVTPAEWVHDEV